MRRKHPLVFLVLTGLFALLGSPARGRVLPVPELTVASATTNCMGGCLSVTADQLTAGDMDKITYTFTLTSNTGGSPLTVSGEIDFTADSSGSFSKTVCFNWLSSGSLSDNFTVTGSAALITPNSTSGPLTIDFGGGSGSVVLNCGTPPTGKTFSIGPSSMEGNLFIHAGDWVSGGYSFSFVNNSHPATNYTVTATVTVPVTCPQGGGAGGNIVVSLGTQTFGVPASNTNWLPTGDANSILSWQGATRAPDLCSGNVMNNQHGAIFTTTVSQNPPAGLVNWRFKYRDPNAKGKGNVNCTDASDPRRNDAATCGASWSQTVRDP